MQERFETFTVLINRISRNIRKIKNHRKTQKDENWPVCYIGRGTDSGTKSPPYCKKHSAISRIKETVKHIHRCATRTCKSYNREDTHLV